MQNSNPAPAKLDNLFGVCHALGEAFGINPLILRIAVVFGILLNAEITLFAYIGAGLAVVAATLITKFASRRSARRA